MAARQIRAEGACRRPLEPLWILLRIQRFSLILYEHICKGLDEASGGAQLGFACITQKAKGLWANREALLDKARNYFPGRFNKIADEPTAESAPAQASLLAAVLASAPPPTQEASKLEAEPAVPQGKESFIRAIYSKDAAPAADTFAEQDAERGAEGSISKRGSMSEQPLLPDLERGDEHLPDSAQPEPEQQDLPSSKEDDPER